MPRVTLAVNRSIVFYCCLFSFDSRDITIKRERGESEAFVDKSNNSVNLWLDFKYRHIWCYQPTVTEVLFTATEAFQKQIIHRAANMSAASVNRLLLCDSSPCTTEESNSGLTFSQLLGMYPGITKRWERKPFQKFQSLTRVISVHLSVTERLLFCAIWNLLLSGILTASPINGSFNLIEQKCLQCDRNRGRRIN